jgi:uncharacterized membrane protein
MEFLDAWRTVAILCMLVYHFLFDLMLFGILSREQMFSPGLDALQLFICCSFILLAGISSRFSRSNLRRGIMTLGAGVLVMIGGALVDQPILFGILQFLGTAMVLYGLVGKWIEKLPAAFVMAGCLLLFFVTRFWTDHVQVSASWLFPLGFRGPDFYSADYFPLLPWIFLFLFGAALGVVLRRCSWKGLYRPFPRILTWPGRYSLLIYLFHQPVLYGLCLLLFR